MFAQKSPAMVGASRIVKSQNGALMQTLRVCVRKRRCLLNPPRGYAPPWNPRPEACRLWTPALGFSHPKTLDNGRACPLTQPGGIPSPSTPARGATPDKPCAVLIRAQGALLPENPAQETSLSRTLDDRCAGQRRTATRSRTASKGNTPAPLSRVVPCLL